MQKLVFINGNGKEIDLTSGNFGITNWAGLSNTSLNIQSQQVPFEDGGVFLDALMEQRELDFTVAIQDNNNLELRYQKKRELISALNPKLGEGTLIYTNDYLSRQIKAVPQIPVFENKNSNDAGTLKAYVSFTCCNPYWEDVEETEVIMNSNDRTMIENKGDLPCSVYGEILPTPSVTNLKLKNLTTEKEIGLFGTENNIINFSTQVGNKYIKDFVVSKNNIFISCEYKLLEYINNKYVLFGGNPYDQNISYVFMSEKLGNWEIISLDIKCFISIANKNSLYVAVNNTDNIYYSMDLKEWTPVTLSTQVRKVIYVKERNKFYAFGSTIYSSVNGIGWTEVSTSQVIGDVCYYPTDDVFVKINMSGSDYSTTSTISKSADLDTWEQVNSINHQAYQKIVYDVENGLVVIGGYSIDQYSSRKVNFYRSSDLESWTVSSTKISGSYNFYAFANSSTEMFALIKPTGSGNSVIYSSYDDSVWTYIKSIDKNFNVITWIEGDLYYAGIGGQIDSLYGNISIPNSTDILNDFIYSPELNKYALSVGRYIYISDDLIKFKTVLTITGTYLYFGYHEESKVFVAIGWLKAFYSYDLENWVEITSYQPLLSNVYGIKYIKDLKKMFVYGYDINRGYIAWSDDGIKWYQGTMQGGFNYAITDVAYSVDKDLLLCITESATYKSVSETLGSLWENVSAIGGNSLMYSKKEKKFFLKRTSSLLITEDGLNYSSTSMVLGQSMFYNEDSGEIFIYNTDSGNIYNSYNGFDWKDLYSDYIVNARIKTYNSNVYIFGLLDIGNGGSVFDILRKTENDNIIDKITSESNFTLNLEIGENIILLSESGGSATVVLKYRQKYIGV